MKAIKIKTKMMNRFFISIVSIFFLITCCCTSCKEIEREELQIIIQNRTDNPIHISLYPKGDIGGLYPICDGCGGHKTTEFALNPNNNDRYYWNEVIFTTSDLNIKPYTLAAKVFDSIYISTANKDNVIIKFTHENVIGYSENIFSENSNWDFRMLRWSEPTQFRKNPVKYHQYKFMILEDKIIIEQN